MTEKSIPYMTLPANAVRNLFNKSPIHPMHQMFRCSLAKSRNHDN
jgi:hypothetical protein